MKTKKIGIIGINGRYGQWLARFFSDRKCSIIGSDLNSPISSREVIERSEVVIFAVPLNVVVEVVAGLIVCSRREQLWMDVSSLKVSVLAEMMKSSAEVAGLHPLFAPPASTTWKGGTVVVCPERVPTWTRWLYGDFLAETEAKVIMMNPQRHDTAMLYVQNLPHVATLAGASLIAELGPVGSELPDVATALSRRYFMMAARMLSQNPGVYADIQFCNRESVSLIDRYIAELQTLRGLIALGDRDGFLKKFEQIRARLGDKILDAPEQNLDS